MKPFDLEKALAGAKVVTQDGREVTQLTKLQLTNRELLCGVVHEAANWPIFWKLDGSLAFDFIDKDRLSLGMAPGMGEGEDETI